MFDLAVRKTCFKAGFNYLAGALGRLSPMKLNDVMRAPMVAVQVAQQVDAQDVECFAHGNDMGPYATLLRQALQGYGCQDVPVCELRGFMGDVITGGVRYAWAVWDDAHQLSEQRGLHVYLSRSELPPACRAKLKL